MIHQVRDFLRTRSQAYRQVFKGVHASRVLQDLGEFCRANESTFHTDSRLEGILQGRREVWLRITKHLNMTEAELLQHYNPTKGA